MGRMAGCRAGSEGGHRGRQAEQRHAVQFEGRGTRVPLTRAEPRHLCQLPLILVCVLPYALRAGHSCEGGVYVLSFGRGGTRALGHTREKRERPAPATLARAARRK